MSLPDPPGYLACPFDAKEGKQRRGASLTLSVGATFPHLGPLRALALAEGSRPGGFSWSAFGLSFTSGQKGRNS